MITHRPAAMRTRWKTAIAVCASAIALAAMLGAAMTTAPAPPVSASVSTPGSASAPAKLAPTPQEGYVARRVADIVAREHYRRLPLDDQLSSLILDRYLNTLDGERSYFYASDIADFERYRYELDDAIKEGDMDPAFAIFRRYQQRTRERMQYAIDLLATKPDFTVDESFHFDRTKQPWPADKAEMNELWRKRVKNDALSLVLAGKKWPAVADTLRKRYEHVIKRIAQTEPEDVFETFMNAYVLSLDPHSNYFSPRDSQEYNIQMSLSYEGIGASLQLKDDYVTVIDVIAGGPAAISGKLAANDRITAVGEGNTGEMTDVIGWRLDDVVQKIRGKIGTVVRLQILPAGAAPGPDEHIIELTRAKVTLEAQAAKKELRLIDSGDRKLRVGVITVPGFYEDIEARRDGDADYRSTTRDVRRLIGELQAEGGIDALVLDLRGDGGGFLPEATALTGLFIDQGPVVQVRDTDGHREVLDDPEAGVVYSGPLAVLVDRTSASASEIFAGAIQDYHRGLVLGQTTFGKGTVQQLIPLDRWSGPPSLGQLTVTIAKFYRVTGESTQLKGVVPDIELPSPIDASDVGESVLHYALPWDRIDAVGFRPLAFDGGSVPDLAKAQSARTAADANYRWMMQGLATLETMRKEHSVSLNLKERQQERTTQEQQRIAQENARRSQANLPLVKTLDEIKTDELPDVVLSLATRIAADQADGSAGRYAADTSSAAKANKPL